MISSLVRAMGKPFVWAFNLLVSDRPVGWPQVWEALGSNNPQRRALSAVVQTSRRRHREAVRGIEVVRAFHRETVGAAHLTLGNAREST